MTRSTALTWVTRVRERCRRAIGSVYVSRNMAVQGASTNARYPWPLPWPAAQLCKSAHPSMQPPLPALEDLLQQRLLRLQCRGTCRGSLLSSTDRHYTVAHATKETLPASDHMRENQLIRNTHTLRVRVTVRVSECQYTTSAGLHREVSDFNPKAEYKSACKLSCRSDINPSCSGRICQLGSDTNEGHPRFRRSSYKPREILGARI